MKFQKQFTATQGKSKERNQEGNKEENASVSTNLNNTFIYYKASKFINSALQSVQCLTPFLCNVCSPNIPYCSVIYIYKFNEKLLLLSFLIDRISICLL